MLNLAYTAGILAVLRPWQLLRLHSVRNGAINTVAAFNVTMISIVFAMAAQLPWNLGNSDPWLCRQRDSFANRQSRRFYRRVRQES